MAHALLPRWCRSSRYWLNAGTPETCRGPGAQWWAAGPAAAAAATPRAAGTRAGAIGAAWLSPCWSLSTLPCGWRWRHSDGSSQQQAACAGLRPLLRTAAGAARAGLDRSCLPLLFLCPASRLCKCWRSLAWLEADGCEIQYCPTALSTTRAGARLWPGTAVDFPALPPPAKSGPVRWRAWLAERTPRPLCAWVAILERQRPAPC